jgi:hypothetical protein
MQDRQILWDFNNDKFYFVLSKVLQELRTTLLNEFERNRLFDEEEGLNSILVLSKNPLHLKN